ncbi:hypothetical protein LTS08_001880 [Lithohypha guttulata]|uniref:uncharacterized protein n=1 Tax=Lithohypha guttulata TaxID=1690604 RepID=UPI002DE1433A|nr:hypothetical protein LTR51_003436 [Lithohypha guttulata]KAK5105603.1 hypothetical protein LTS08_001880 [Lithohypha guttulata]
MRNGIVVASKHALRSNRRAIAAPFFQLRRWESTVAPALKPQRRWSTPLAETIAKAIEVTGPISIASYMRQCLTSPDGGYYTTTRPTSDQFGRRGDFITSPEISQVFGELVGVWFLTEWMGQGRPATGVQFMEVGPGRGTLMSDILRTAAQFKSFVQAIEAVWLVEAGEGLREHQRKLLCGEEARMNQVQEKGQTLYWEAMSKHGNDIPIRWVEDIALLPENQGSTQKMPFIVAHEFFDALPIHAFESVAAAPESEKVELLDKHGRPMVRPNPASKVPQWRELLVAPTQAKFDLFAPAKAGGLQQKQPETDFHLTIAKASNPNSIVIPERPRYRKLKQQPQSRIEVSPESYRYMQDFSKRIGGNLSGGKPAGAALVIDYGPPDTVPVNSFRGIKEHKIVSPFSFAGQADVSADVDFGALADAAVEASEGVEVHGPVEQGLWLSQLGVQDRAARLMKNVDEQKKKDIASGWRRLVEGGPTGMGKAYKVMAVLPENGGQRRPVGFGGDLK